jgi:hypothetical protein
MELKPPMSAQEYAARKDASITLLAFKKSLIEGGMARTVEEATDMAGKLYVLHNVQLDTLFQKV